MVGHVGDPGFGVGPQIQMLLQQLPEQLAGVDLQLLFELAVA